MRDLPGQASRAAGQEATTCDPDGRERRHAGVSAMTSATRLPVGLRGRDADPDDPPADARIHVLGVPASTGLWQIESGRFLARTAWRFLHPCEALLERPRSKAAEDVARRSLVRNRVMSFNRVLQDVCAEYVQCSHDGGAVFRTRFDRGDISSRLLPSLPRRPGEAR